MKLLNVVALLAALSCVIASPVWLQHGNNARHYSSLEEAVRQLRLKLQRDHVVGSDANTHVEIPTLSRQVVEDGEKPENLQGFTDVVNDGSGTFRPIRPGANIPSARQFAEESPKVESPVPTASPVSSAVASAVPSDSLNPSPSSGASPSASFTGSPSPVTASSTPVAPTTTPTPSGSVLPSSVVPSVSISSSPSFSAIPSTSVSSTPVVSVSTSISPVASVSTTAEVSVSPTITLSTSLSAAPTVSISVSPISAFSVSPSTSVAPSGSVAPSLSTSVAPSGSVAPSPSSSVAPSGSAAPSPSTTAVPSGSVAPSPSSSVAPSGSVAPSPSSSVSPSGSVPATSSSPLASTSVSAAFSPSTTPEVTPSPEDDSVCFPAHATVELQDGSIKRMDRVQLGDRVLVEDGSYSEVFMFTHKLANVKYNFVRLTTDSSAQLSLTKSHYLYVNGRLAAASSVNVGDTLILADGSLTTVTNISSVQAMGLFNPQTVHGDIVVNGIRASTYTTTVLPRTAHALLAPLRAVYERIGFSMTAFDTGSAFWPSVVPSGPLVN